MDITSPSDKFEYIDCTICLSSNLKLFFSTKYGKLKQKESLNYEALGINSDTMLYAMKCKNCKFIFVNPRVKDKYGFLIYNKSKENMYTLKPWLIENNNIKNIIHTRKRKLGYIKPLLRCIEKVDINNNLNLFDFGSGFGHTMKLAEEFGINSYGVDLDNERLKYSKSLGLKVVHPDLFLNEYPNFKADIIIIHSVLEHILDLNKFMLFIKKIAHNNTILFVDSTHPSIIRIEKFSGEFVKAHFVEHVNYFSSTSLARIFSNYNFYPASKNTFRTVSSLQDLLKNNFQYLFSSLVPYITGFIDEIFIYKE